MFVDFIPKWEFIHSKPLKAMSLLPKKLSAAILAYKYQNMGSGKLNQKKDYIRTGLWVHL